MRLLLRCLRLRFLLFFLLLLLDKDFFLPCDLRCFLLLWSLVVFDLGC